MQSCLTRETTYLPGRGPHGAQTDPMKARCGPVSWMIQSNVRTSDFKDPDDVSEVRQPSDTGKVTYSPLPAR